MTDTPVRYPIPPASDRALEVARTWPLSVTYDVGERLAPDGGRVTGWQLHVRCARGLCMQSVMCVGNDSGPYQWTWRDQLAVGVLGHIMQCHREGSGVDEAPEPTGGREGEVDATG